MISLLPGFFLIGLNIGTGSVTAMSKAGAQYGMSLLWAIAISCYITYFLIHLYGKFTLVTGQTALYAFRKYIHPAVGVFFIVALTVNVCGSVMGVMGIIADVCHEWSRQVFDRGISPILFATFFITMVYMLFLSGKTKNFEKALAIIVGIMSLSFVINFFMVSPSLKSILSGLVPSIPEGTSKGGETPFLVVASMVGTTVFSGLFILRSVLVREAGWKYTDMKLQKRDARISALMMFIISTSIMASAAGTLFIAEVRLDHASQMLGLLQPMAGNMATAIFGVGIIAAGISSQFPNVIMIPMLLSDVSNSPLNMKAGKVRLMVLAISLLGLVVPVFKVPPVLVMIASQAFGALLLPFTVGCMLYLGNKKSIMKEHSFGVSTSVFMVFTLLFSLFMAYNSLKGILSLVMN